MLNNVVIGTIALSLLAIILWNAMKIGVSIIVIAIVCAVIFRQKKR